MNKNEGTLRNHLKRNIHILFALYLPVYLAGFFYLEKTITTEFHALNSPIDNIIPFVNIFIIPYYLWFLYVAAACIYFFFVSQREFVKMVSFLVIGMTIYLIICYLYPNGLKDFRPTGLTDSGLDKLVIALYGTDTSTNVFPSIHVYNSIGVNIAVSRHKSFKHPVVKAASLILCVLICLSTMFLKQHSVIDVLGGLVMGAFIYELVYKTKLSTFIDKWTWE